MHTCCSHQSPYTSLIWWASPFTHEEGSGVMPIHDLCCSKEYSSNQIVTCHFKSYCGCPGVPQAHALTNQVLDLHVAVVCAVYYMYVEENALSCITTQEAPPTPQKISNVLFYHQRISPPPPRNSHSRAGEVPHRLTVRPMRGVALSLSPCPVSSLKAEQGLRMRLVALV